MGFASTAHITSVRNNRHLQRSGTKRFRERSNAQREAAASRAVWAAGRSTVDYGARALRDKRQRYSLAVAFGLAAVVLVLLFAC